MGVVKAENLRVSYTKGKLEEAELPKDPMILFTDWFNQSAGLGNDSTWVDKLKNKVKTYLFGTVLEANAMSLSTVDSHGYANSRMVLMKGYSEDGIEFFTNYKSDKGRDIESNSSVSCVFWWPTWQRQVIIRGIATKLTSTRNDEYFNLRPRGHKIGAWASHQSKKIDGRETLESMFADIEKKYESVATADIPRPDFWGGYIVKIESIEFWQGRFGRLHDRIRYYKTKKGGWLWKRLNP